jgi:hypothetical protein
MKHRYSMLIEDGEDGKVGWAVVHVSDFPGFPLGKGTSKDWQQAITDATLRIVTHQAQERRR